MKRTSFLTLPTLYTRRRLKEVANLTSSLRMVKVLYYIAPGQYFSQVMSPAPR